jgi:hypothetical protein
MTATMQAEPWLVLIYDNRDPDDIRWLVAEVRECEPDGLADRLPSGIVEAAAGPGSAPVTPPERCLVWDIEKPREAKPALRAMPDEPEDEALS